MSREIIFRAKPKRMGGTLGDWIEGGYCQRYETTYCCVTDSPNPIHHYIARDEMTDWNLPNKIVLYEVDPSTICQYTGLKDKNGAKIFEGDILEGRLDDDCPDDITMAVVEWLDFGWAIRQLGCDCDPDPMDETDTGLWVVWGNVFDSPEMLEAEGIGGEKQWLIKSGKF